MASLIQCSPDCLHLGALLTAKFPLPCSVARPRVRCAEHLCSVHNRCLPYALDTKALRQWQREPESRLVALCATCQDRTPLPKGTEKGTEI